MDSIRRRVVARQPASAGVRTRDGRPVEMTCTVPSGSGEPLLVDQA